MVFGDVILNEAVASRSPFGDVFKILGVGGYVCVYMYVVILERCRGLEELTLPCTVKNLHIAILTPQILTNSLLLTRKKAY